MREFGECARGYRNGFPPDFHLEVVEFFGECVDPGEIGVGFVKPLRDLQAFCAGERPFAGGHVLVAEVFAFPEVFDDGRHLPLDKLAGAVLELEAGLSEFAEVEFDVTAQLELGRLLSVVDDPGLHRQDGLVVGERERALKCDFALFR